MWQDDKKAIFMDLTDFKSTPVLIKLISLHYNNLYSILFIRFFILFIIFVILSLYIFFYGSAVLYFIFQVVFIVGFLLSVIHEQFRKF